MAIIVNNRTRTVEEEGYFVSMTDMMVGMLFIFIIMLMFFAMKFNEAAEAKKEAVNALIGANDTRNSILDEIGKSLKLQGVSVVIDKENGILRLPESILFDVNKSDPTEQGSAALAKLAESLSTVLPCYTSLPGRKRPDNCPDSPHKIEAIFIEGHTDNTGSREHNWQLSMDRALHTYQSITSIQPDLGLLRNPENQAVLSIAGYGMQRPVIDNDTPEHKSRNRRIDLRFIMSQPKASSPETPGLEFKN